MFRHTTHCRGPLDESSARHSDLYRTKYNTHRGQISMPPAGFEPAVPENELLQPHALDRVANGTDLRRITL